MDGLQFFNIPAIQYLIFFSFTSYPMHTLSFVDTESGTDNSITDALQVDDSSCSDVLCNTAIELKHPSNVHFTSSFSSEIVYSLCLTDYGFVNWEHLTTRNLFSYISKNLPPSYAQFCHNHQLAIVQSQILLWTVKSSGKIIIMLPQDNYFFWKYTFDIEQSTFMLANVILDKLERGAAKELCPELDFHNIANKPNALTQHDDVSHTITEASAKEVLLFVYLKLSIICNKPLQLLSYYVQTSSPPGHIGKSGNDLSRLVSLHIYGWLSQTQSVIRSFLIDKSN